MMGFLDFLRRPDYMAQPVVTSPWADSSSLLPAIGGELFGLDVFKNMPLGRTEALSIPAVAKARNLLVSTISKFPLKALNKDGVLADQPAWLYRTNAEVSPYHRMSATVDDLIFSGKSLWLARRGTKQSGAKFAPILEASWVPLNDWAFRDGQYFVHEIPVNEDDVILFHLPLFPGLLAAGSRTLRGARDTELAWTARIKNPIPLTELNVTDDTNLTQVEVDTWEAAWLAKHAAGEPALGVTPAGMELKTHGEGSDAELYIENRNAIRTDVGSFLNVRASMLDGTAGIDSLTYSTTEGERNAFYEFDLPFWTDPIEAALSQDKCVPAGQRVRFDKYETYSPTPTPTGAPTED